MSSSASTTFSVAQRSRFALSRIRAVKNSGSRKFTNGLTLENAPLLLDALKGAAVTGDAVLGKLDKYGQRYVIDFEFAGPGGQAILRSVWIVRTDEDFPRLVTCYML